MVILVVRGISEFLVEDPLPSGIVSARPAGSTFAVSPLRASRSRLRGQHHTSTSELPVVLLEQSLNQLAAS
jgi:hypothetical protein